MRIEEIINVLSDAKVLNNQNFEITSFTTDTRKISENSCFIGLKGEKFDGSDFFQEALEKGAKIAIINKNTIVNEDYLRKNNKTVLLVNDTLISLGDLAKYKREKLGIPVIAITGSAGKTSTKDMVYSVLKEKFNVLKTPGNLNNQIGLPLTILSIKDEKMLVLEMGMNHFGEISYLTKIACPDIAIITNVGTAHIGNLGSRENILKAKLEILEGLKPGGTLIINNDNDLLHNWYLDHQKEYKIVTVGLTNKSKIEPKKVNLKENYSTYLYHDTMFTIPLGGEQFVYDSLFALAVGETLKMLPAQISTGLKRLELSSNRMNLIVKNEITVIDDTYNANYDAVCYALKYLGNLEGRNIACLGTMRELGKYSESLHQSLGKVIKDNKINILITVGEYTDLINTSAIEYGFNEHNSYHFNTNKEAIELINKLKQPGDNILVKASFLMNFKEIISEIIK